MISATSRIIGLDPGTHRTGFAVLDRVSRKLPSVVEYGTIEVPPNTGVSESLLVIRSQLISILDKFKPDLASVEELFFHKNVKTAGTVYQARGVLLLTLAEYKLKIIEPNITQIKKGVTGSGKADKKQIHSALKILLKLEELKGHDDSWDAIACAFVGLNMS